MPISAMPQPTGGGIIVSCRSSPKKRLFVMMLMVIVSLCLPFVTKAQVVVLDCSAGPLLNFTAANSSTEFAIKDCNDATHPISVVFMQTFNVTMTITNVMLGAVSLIGNTNLSLTIIGSTFKGDATNTSSTLSCSPTAATVLCLSGVETYLSLSLTGATVTPNAVGVSWIYQNNSVGSNSSRLEHSNVVISGGSVVVSSPSSAMYLSSILNSVVSITNVTSITHAISSTASASAQNSVYFGTITGCTITLSHVGWTFAPMGPVASATSPIRFVQVNTLSNSTLNVIRVNVNITLTITYVVQTQSFQCTLFNVTGVGGSMINGGNTVVVSSGSFTFTSAAGSPSPLLTTTTTYQQYTVVLMDGTMPSTSYASSVTVSDNTIVITLPYSSTNAIYIGSYTGCLFQMALTSTSTGATIASNQWTTTVAAPGSVNSGTMTVVAAGGGTSSMGRIVCAYNTFNHNNITSLSVVVLSLSTSGGGSAQVYGNVITSATSSTSITLVACTGSSGSSSAATMQVYNNSISVNSASSTLSATLVQLSASLSTRLVVGCNSISSTLTSPNPLASCAITTTDSTVSNNQIALSAAASLTFRGLDLASGGSSTTVNTFVVENNTVSLPSASSVDAAWLRGIGNSSTSYVRYNTITITSVTSSPVTYYPFGPAGSTATVLVSHNYAVLNGSTTTTVGQSLFTDVPTRDALSQMCNDDASRLLLTTTPGTTTPPVGVVCCGNVFTAGCSISTSFSFAHVGGGGPSQASSAGGATGSLIVVNNTCQVSGVYSVTYSVVGSYIYGGSRVSISGNQLRGLNVGTLDLTWMRGTQLSSASSSLRYNYVTIDSLDALLTKSKVFDEWTYETCSAQSQTFVCGNTAVVYGLTGSLTLSLLRSATASDGGKLNVTSNGVSVANVSLSGVVTALDMINGLTISGNSSSVSCTNNTIVFRNCSWSTGVSWQLVDTVALSGSATTALVSQNLFVVSASPSSLADASSSSEANRLSLLCPTSNLAPGLSFAFLLCGNVAALFNCSLSSSLSVTMCNDCTPPPSSSFVIENNNVSVSDQPLAAVTASLVTLTGSTSTSGGVHISRNLITIQRAMSVAWTLVTSASKVGLMVTRNSVYCTSAMNRSVGDIAALLLFQNATVVACPSSVSATYPSYLVCNNTMIAVGVTASMAVKAVTSGSFYFLSSVNVTFNIITAQDIAMASMILLTSTSIYSYAQPVPILNLSGNVMNCFNASKQCGVSFAQSMQWSGTPPSIAVQFNDIKMVPSADIFSTSSSLSGLCLPLTSGFVMCANSVRVGSGSSNNSSSASGSGSGGSTLRVVLVEGWMSTTSSVLVSQNAVDISMGDTGLSSLFVALLLSCSNMVNVTMTSNTFNVALPAATIMNSTSVSLFGCISCSSFSGTIRISNNLIVLFIAAAESSPQMSGNGLGVLRKVTIQLGSGVQCLPGSDLSVLGNYINLTTTNFSWSSAFPQQSLYDVALCSGCSATAMLMERNVMKVGFLSIASSNTSASLSSCAVQLAPGWSFRAAPAGGASSSALVNNNTIEVRFVSLLTWSASTSAAFITTTVMVTGISPPAASAPSGTDQLCCTSLGFTNNVVLVSLYNTKDSINNNNVSTSSSSTSSSTTTTTKTNITLVATTAALNNASSYLSSNFVAVTTTTTKGASGYTSQQELWLTGCSLTNLAANHNVGIQGNQFIVVNLSVVHVKMLASDGGGVAPVQNVSMVQNTVSCNMALPPVSGTASTGDNPSLAEIQWVSLSFQVLQAMPSSTIIMVVNNSVQVAWSPSSSLFQLNDTNSSNNNNNNNIKTIAMAVVVVVAMSSSSSPTLNVSSLRMLLQSNDIAILPALSGSANTSATAAAAITLLNLTGISQFTAYIVNASASAASAYSLDPALSVVLSGCSNGVVAANLTDSNSAALVGRTSRTRPLTWTVNNCNNVTIRSGMNNMARLSLTNVTSLNVLLADGYIATTSLAGVVTNVSLILVNMVVNTSGSFDVSNKSNDSLSVFAFLQGTRAVNVSIAVQSCLFGDLMRAVDSLISFGGSATYSNLVVSCTQSVLTLTGPLIAFPTALIPVTIDSVVVIMNQTTIRTALGGGLLAIHGRHVSSSIRVLRMVLWKSTISGLVVPVVQMVNLSATPLPLEVSIVIAGSLVEATSLSNHTAPSLWSISMLLNNSTTTNQFPNVSLSTSLDNATVQGFASLLRVDGVSSAAASSSLTRAKMAIDLACVQWGANPVGRIPRVASVGYERLTHTYCASQFLGGVSCPCMGTVSVTLPNATRSVSESSGITASMDSESVSLSRYSPSRSRSTSYSGSHTSSPTISLSHSKSTSFSQSHSSSPVISSSRSQSTTWSPSHSSSAVISPSLIPIIVPEDCPPLDIFPTSLMDVQFGGIGGSSNDTTTTTTRASVLLSLSDAYPRNGLLVAVGEPLRSPLLLTWKGDGTSMVPQPNGLLAALAVDATTMAEIHCIATSPRIINCTFPALHLSIDVSESIIVVAAADLFTIPCRQTTRSEGSAQFVVVPSVTNNLQQTMEVVASIASVGGFVSAMTSGSSPDAQVLGAVMMMSCSTPGQQKAAGAMKYVLSPFYDLGWWVMTVGNVGIGVVFFALHALSFVLARKYYERRQRSLAHENEEALLEHNKLVDDSVEATAWDFDDEVDDGNTKKPTALTTPSSPPVLLANGLPNLRMQSKLRFPSLDMAVVTFLLNGCILASCKMLFDPSTETVNTGERLVGVAGVVCVVGFLLLEAHVIRRDVVPISHYNRYQHESTLAKLMLPSGYWIPVRLTRAYGFLFLSLRSHMHMYFLLAAVSGTVMTGMTAIQPSTTTGCVIQICCMGIIAMFVAVVVAWKRPYRAPFTHVFVSISNGLLAVLLFTFAIAIAHSSRTAETIKTVIALLQTLLMIGRTIHEVTTKVYEIYFLKRTEVPELSDVDEEEEEEHELLQHRLPLPQEELANDEIIVDLDGEADDDESTRREMHREQPLPAVTTTTTDGDALSPPPSPPPSEPDDDEDEEGEEHMKNPLTGIARVSRIRVLSAPPEFNNDDECRIEL